MWSNFKFLHMTGVENSEISPHVYNLWCFVAFYAVLFSEIFFLRFTLFCREICYVAIYALLRGEKLSKKLSPWRKKDKYDVCLSDFQVYSIRGVVFEHEDSDQG